MKVRLSKGALLLRFGQDGLLLFSHVYRDCHFYGNLGTYENYIRFGSVPSPYRNRIMKMYFYAYVPFIKRQLCADLWL